MQAEQTFNYRFEIRLLIKHPTFDPGRITHELGLQPGVSWRVDTERSTLHGSPPLRIRRESMWNYSHPVIGSRFFFEHVSELLGKLEACTDFLTELTDTGGTVDLIVNLPGNINIGDVMKLEVMKRLVALRVQLGVEVFPNFR